MTKVGILLLIGLSVFAGLLWFPPHEGAAAGLDLVSIYLNPFIIYIYIAFIPFFFGIFQTIRFISLIERKKPSSLAAVNAIKNVKYCALTLIGFFVIALAWIRTMSGNDDPAGAMATGTFLIICSAIVAFVAHSFQKKLQKRSK